jgi:hypothetical protein
LHIPLKEFIGVERGEDRLTLQIILLHGIVSALQAFRGEADLFLLLYFMILSYVYGLRSMLQSLEFTHTYQTSLHMSSIMDVAYKYGPGM